MKNRSGITLVSLVITIIILLILSGVAITTLTQTGLFEKAKQAKNSMENSQILENKVIAEYENKINSSVVGDRDKITIDKEEYENLKAKIDEISKGNIVHVYENVTLNVTNGEAIFEHNLGKENYVAYIIPRGLLISGDTCTNKTKNNCKLHIIWANNGAPYTGTFNLTVILIEN